VAVLREQFAKILRRIYGEAAPGMSGARWMIEPRHAKYDRDTSGVRAAEVPRLRSRLRERRATPPRPR
jgi:hypothetical protein